MPKPTLTVEQIRKDCKSKITVREGDNAEMVPVKVTCPECFCHGGKHPRGEVFPMEISLIPSHVAAGQVELVEGKAKKD